MKEFLPDLSDIGTIVSDAFEVRSLDIELANRGRIFDLEAMYVFKREQFLETLAKIYSKYSTEYASELLAKIEALEPVVKEVCERLNAGTKTVNQIFPNQQELLARISNIQSVLVALNGSGFDKITTFNKYQADEFEPAAVVTCKTVIDILLAMSTLKEQLKTTITNLDSNTAKVKALTMLDSSFRVRAIEDNETSNNDYYKNLYACVDGVSSVLLMDTYCNYVKRLVA